MTLQLGLDVSLERGVVPVRGELDLAGAPALGDRVDALLNDGVVEVVLDLSDVGFADSHGLAAVVDARDRVRAAGGEVVVLQPSRSVRRLAALLGVDL